MIFVSPQVVFAVQVNCSEAPYNGVIDGNIYPYPDNVKIDTNCTIINFPNGMSTNFDFDNNDPTPYLVIFDNVLHTGQMSCNTVAGHMVWFVNGSSSAIQEGCQNLLIPVEKIEKQSPAASATIGIPFTYTLTIPVLYDARTGTVINSSGSLNDLHSIVLTDDLNATGAALTYVDHNAYWQGSNSPVYPTFTNTSGVLKFDFKNLPIIPTEQQIILEITVVLDDTPTNIPGTVFTNTAKWSFGRLIDGVFYEPLPGEWGLSDPMIIVEPNLLVTKTSSENALNIGDSVTFYIDLENTGGSDAWNTTILDELPGEMCEYDPTTGAGVRVQVFAADGVTPVSGLLNQGTDYSVTYTGAPQCQLNLNMQSSAAVIGPSQHMIVSYQSQLNNGVTQNGLALTNVAGATQWFSGESSFAGRRQYNRTLSDGSPGIADFQDSETVTTALAGYYFQKTVSNINSGMDPATIAVPGDRLRYRVRLSNVDQTINDIRISDQLDPASFDLTTFEMVTLSSNNYTYKYDAGTGLLEIEGDGTPLNVDVGEVLVVEFEVTLRSAIASNTAVENQATLNATGMTALSDDPYVSGIADPTITLISSMPAFEVWKTSQDVTGDPDELVAGDTLRYTITVKNVGNENAVNTILQDAIPNHSEYLANTTLLNGMPVADPSPGVSPLQNGLLIYAHENTTPGYMRADAASTAGNEATVVFDVVIDGNAVDGTIVANQGFVNADGQGSGPIPQEPSDDPATAVPDDPTLDVVGNFPLVDAHKTVQLLTDNNSDGIVDPGDMLRYTTVISNLGAAAATGVVFTDAVPANTTYISDSVHLNNFPVGQPDGGNSPLLTGIDVSSSDLTPPLPGNGNGTLSIGATAVVIFDVRVNAGVPPGTIISNQGVVSTNESPDELTDADGIDSNGDQPTQVVVGDAQLLSIVKEVFVVNGGAAVAESQLEYVIRVNNIANRPATQVRVTDDLSPMAGRVTYIPGSASLNGSPDGISYAGTVISAEYAAQYGDLPIGGSAVVRFRVRIEPSVPMGTTLTNTGIVTWNDPAQTESAVVSLDVGGIPNSAIFNGIVWHDANLNRIDEGNERHLEAWSVELYRNNQLLATVWTNADGTYRLTGVTPNAGSSGFYELRFRAAGAGPNAPSLGTADSIFTNGPQRISDISVSSGGILQNLNLPIWPNGTIYNSINRVPVPGASLSLVNTATDARLPGSCFDDPLQETQITALDGFYKFDLNFSDAACPPGGTYLIEVTPPAAGYMADQSQVIPAASDATKLPFSVPDCPGTVYDAVPTTAEYCEVTAYAGAPPISVPPRTAGTTYYLSLVLDDVSMPGHSQIFNNSIPIDPVLGGAVAITKTSSLINVSRGKLVPYTITVTNAYGVPLYDISIVDHFPAGFKYMAGSSRLNQNRLEPQISGQELIWKNLELQVNETLTFQFLLIVGSGVSEGEYVNSAYVLNSAMGTRISVEATATVQVVPDPDFDCTDVIGKVFDDRNLNGWQDRGELGLPGVRVVTARGLTATTDKHGRFHITCATVPDQDRGSNFILKIDDRSLPSGYRMTTENPRVQRATRGKMLRFNFGATIHRVVRLDIADGVFEPDSNTMRPQWQPRIAMLIEKLHEAPSILRLSYLADVESKSLVRKRMAALKKEISRQWKKSHGQYRLTIETEIYWLRDEPISDR